MEARSFLRRRSCRRCIPTPRRSTLKKNSKQKIQDTADVYFADIRSEYTRRQDIERLRAKAQELQASQTAARDVKADNKKPVAK